MTQINYSCGILKHTLKKNILLKNERIWITTAGEDAFHMTTLRPKFGTFSWQKLTDRKVKPQLAIHVDPLSTQVIVKHCVKNQFLWLRTLGEVAFGITLPQVNDRYCCSLMGTSGSLKAACEPVHLLACCYKSTTDQSHTATFSKPTSDERQRRRNQDSTHVKYDSLCVSGPRSSGWERSNHRRHQPLTGRQTAESSS